MKALTICQPYATMIARGEKRVENRSWPTNYRGLLYIHAGKSRSWLQEGDEEDYPGMPFGAIVAVARLVDCVNYEYPDSWIRRHAWLVGDEHAGGPWCWILDSVTPIGPWPWRGAQGLFDIDEAAFDAEVNRILGIREPISRPVMNPPADEAEARNRVHAAPRQADSDAACRGMAGPLTESEAQPVMPTARDLACAEFVPDPFSKFCDKCGYERSAHRRAAA